MTTGLKEHRVLIAGVLSPFGARYASKVVFVGLTSHSSDVDADWQFRLAAAMAVIIAPFLMTVWLAIQERRAGGLSASAKAGVVLASLSLVLLAIPVQGGVRRWHQEQNLAKTGVLAPS